MTILTNLTALISGASAGIGEACAKKFAAAGFNLVLCARRSALIEKLAINLESEHDVSVETFELDVRDANAVKSTLSNIAPNIDVLINNAGLSRGLAPLQEGLLTDWDEMIDTNVKGLLYVSRLIAPLMAEKGKGQIINIGSIAGREVYPNGAVYCASKHAVSAINEGMRMDLNSSGVKVSTVDPGLVNTEFSSVRFHGDKERADAVYKGMTPLIAEDVASTVLYVAQQPAHVNIAEVVILPTDQASATVVNRK